MASDDKTEEPSQRRLDEARKKGQVPKSQELNTVVVLFVAFYAIRASSVQFYFQLEEHMRHGLTMLGKVDFSPMTVVHEGIVTVAFMAWVMAPILGFIFLAALVVNFLQVGLMLSGQGLMPNFSKLNPASGLSRMFSKQSLVQLVKSIAEITLVLYTLKSVLLSKGLVIFQMEHMEPIQALATLAQLTWDVVLRIVMVLLVIALLDYMYQKWQHTQNLKMTKQEVKDEYKQQEGDPHVKGRIRSKMREMARKRMMSQVPQASVVVTNPLHVAVAMQYDFDTMETPLVVAKGQGFVADRIREIARAHAIPIIENRDVARALYDNVEIGGDIPPHMYQAVAEIIAYLFQQKFAHLMAGVPGGGAARGGAAAAAPTAVSSAGAQRLTEVMGQVGMDAMRGLERPAPAAPPQQPMRDPRGIPFKREGAAPPGDEDGDSPG